MNISSIFRHTGSDKTKAAEEKLVKLNVLLKSKVGVGLKFIFSLVIAYLIITFFTIYNLLVGL